MKKKTYQLLKCLPFATTILHLTGNSEFMFCSPGLADGVFDPIKQYAKKHPDEIITERLGKKLLSK